MSKTETKMSNNTGQFWDETENNSTAEVINTFMLTGSAGEQFLHRIQRKEG